MDFFFVFKQPPQVFPLSTHQFGLLHFPPTPFVKGIRKGLYKVHVDHEVPYFSCCQPNLTCPLFTSPRHQSTLLLVVPLPLPKEELFFFPNSAALNHPPAAEAMIWRNTDMGNVDGDG